MASSGAACTISSGVAGLDAAARDDRASALPARWMAGGPGNPLGARAIYRRDHLSHPRHQCAGDDWPGCIVGVLPHGQRGRYRPL
jgi:hypothetical protein